MKMKRERRTLLLAIIASLVLHFAVGISIASFGDKLQPALPEKEKPAELTLVSLAPPSPPPITPVNAPFVDTPKKRETQEAPKEKTFESNANSIAASEQAASGELPVPTREGKEQPDFDLDKHPSSLGKPEEGPTATPRATIAPTPAPTPPPTPSPTATPARTPEPSATPNPELMAMLRATPPPTIRAPEMAETPSPEIPPSPTARPAPSTSYRREERLTRMAGNISNRGITSVNAVGTPLGRYTKQVQDAIGSRWYGYVENNVDRINIGTVGVTFVVERSGRITKLRVVQNSSDESFSNLCIQSVQNAKLPPIPEDVAAVLPSEGMQSEIAFTIYSNQ